MTPEKTTGKLYQIENKAVNNKVLIILFQGDNVTKKYRNNL